MDKKTTKSIWIVIALVAIGSGVVLLSSGLGGSFGKNFSFLGIDKVATVGCPVGQTCSPNDEVNPLTKCQLTEKLCTPVYDPDNGTWSSCPWIQQCFNSDSSFSCVNVKAGDNGLSSCPTNTTICDPSDESCLEPGQSHPIAATEGRECFDSKSCYSNDGSEVLCYLGTESIDSLEEITCPEGYRE